MVEMAAKNVHPEASVHRGVCDTRKLGAFQLPDISMDIFTDSDMIWLKRSLFMQKAEEKSK